MLGNVFILCPGTGNSFGVNTARLCPSVVAPVYEQVEANGREGEMIFYGC